MGLALAPSIERSSTFTIEPASNHTHSFVLLHELGSNGREFGEELIETSLTSAGKKLTEIFPGARFIFPTAGYRHLMPDSRSIVRRANSHGWFDIASLDDLFYRPYSQVKGLVESHDEITRLIKDECQKVSYENVVLGGFGQGCAMALFCLLTSWFPFGGFVGMGGWLPFQPDIDILIGSESETFVFGGKVGPVEEYSFASTEQEHIRAKGNPIVPVVELFDDLLDPNGIPHFADRGTSLSTPIFLGHGAEDEKVEMCNGEAAQRVLKAAGFDVSWNIYPGRYHWYNIPDEIDDIVTFIREKCTII
ncbi:acyl-protein thioesterase [Daldinia caldariorum]|uniref:acyl-protein thioesterase n=1 Tax=Daldinia caldariorum TaxID=326644 RepID=UPI002008DCA3|nr:acyl-protein thioesterase [Daldinia caldariorum]KAI1469542.1 acyl-protein thioesterase [Daldinia caldariorum]